MIFFVATAASSSSELTPYVAPHNSNPIKSQVRKPSDVSDTPAVPVAHPTEHNSYGRTVPSGERGPLFSSEIPQDIGKDDANNTADVSINMII